MNDRVELRAACAWDCDDCGRENFARMVKWEGSPEEERATKEHFGYEPWEEGDFLKFPATVTCAHCGKVFGTRDPHDSYGDDDE